MSVEVISQDSYRNRETWSREVQISEDERVNVV